MGLKSYKLGIEGENIACEFLAQNNFRIIERNFRSHQGEIDIIAKDNKYLIFIEVKYYSFRSMVSPAYSITKNKRGSIVHAARYYLHKKKLYNEPCRFDVVAIYREMSGKTKIDHIINAFGVDRC